LDENNQDVQSIVLDGDTQIDVDDVFADENDASKGLTGIAWAIKHGYAGTNADGLENPIISIHELGVYNKSKKAAAKVKEEKKEETKTVNPVESEPAPKQKPIID
jgi:hypothetical protein